MEAPKLSGGVKKVLGSALPKREESMMEEERGRKLVGQVEEG
jgi:hypothetical protein